MGESLAGTRRFDDKRLFSMIFSLPYVLFEPDICRIAVVGSGSERRAVGYIMGTTDCRAQAKFFSRRFIPRIAARLLFYDSWRHPESAKQVIQFLRAEKAFEAKEPAPAVESSSPREVDLGGPEYPAQLHIDILPGWQGRGLGRRLMESYLGILRSRGISGVYLDTSSRNVKAVPFYEKLGFQLASNNPMEFWEGMPASALCYALKLGGVPSSTSS
jgi:GNAT superfamily N-acetyltransferase